MVEIKSEIFHFIFTEHVNIIGLDAGSFLDSATGKTFFFQSLRNQRILDKLTSNKQVKFIDSLDLLEDLRIDSNTCAVVDELNFSPKQINRVFQETRSAGAYLVLIGRLFVKQVECSVDAIFSLKYENDHFRLEQTFLHDLQKYQNPSGIFTEDSTYIAGIYSEYLDQNVVPVNGRTKFFGYIRRESAPFIIADKAKFGIDLLNLLYKGDRLNSKYLILFLPQCFEEILCEVLDGQKIDLQCFDKETYYERILDCSLAWWNKKKSPIKSVAKFLGEYDIRNSLILKDLKSFYETGKLTDETRAYVLDIQYYFNKMKIEDFVLCKSE